MDGGERQGPADAGRRHHAPPQVVPELQDVEVVTGEGDVLRVGLESVGVQAGDLP